MNASGGVYNLIDRIKLTFNDEKFSNVCFLIGEDEVKFHAHTFILRLGSPVFDSMFYGPLKMDTSKPVKIDDVNPTGFLNVLKFIYGYDFDFDVSEFYDTYTCGNKYLVKKFRQSIAAYVKVKDKVNESNCLMICEQLLKIDNEKELLRYVTNVIQVRSKLIFRDDKFVETSQHMLIHLLTMNALNVTEIDILKACYKWIKYQLVNPTVENEKRIFSQIKPYIRFVDLKLGEIEEFESEMRDILDADEILSIMFHLVNPTKPISINYDGFRISGNYITRRSVVADNQAVFNGGLEKIYVKLIANQLSYIDSIQTFSSLRNIINIKLECVENNVEVNLFYERTRENENAEWNFKFIEPFQINPDYTYQFCFDFGENYNFCSRYKLSDQFDLKSEFDDKIYNFTLSSDSGFHCIRKIDFL